MIQIKRLLVANRGEIARRVMRSASNMGIHTIAIYSDGDANEPFVRDADEGWALDGMTATETYLDMDKVLAVAESSGADAIHPGYGFLSENAGFAQKVIDAGLIWIGPPPEAISTMGDKLAAKNLMDKAGVPILRSIELEDDAELAVAGQTVGFPALVKAAAGGGGKGMRIVDEASKLKAAVASAKREAASAFGDATVFLERYLNGARHVEIQIIGDSHGNLVHCFERECSIQRRHQKIIEEAPSSAVSPELRERMGQAGIQAVRAINYENAGTVEFLLDSSGEFFFLEVNTRLQVEHPVTEEITGLDLVREQIRVAQGLPLSFTQESLEINGHAIEARIYAEDPANDFLPATGEVLAWEMPTTPEARYDSGVASGSTVSVNFDPMLAKVTAHAATREEAALRLGRVLERMRIQGVITNRDFLITVLRHPRFLAGDTTTSFIEEANPSRERTLSEAELRNKAIAASLFIQHRNRSAADVLRTLPSGFRITRMPPERNTFVHRDRELLTEYSSRRDGDFNFTVLGETTTARIMAVSDDCLEYAVNGRRMTTTAHNHGNQWWLHDADGDISLTLKTRFPETNALEAVAGGLISPMPGTVIAVQVASGEQVSAGQVLAIIEAMKMEHSVVSPHDGLVSEVRVAIGDKVEGGELLVVVDDDSGES
tara:strand:- start:3689 stop:5671 length:1983 start_codon:yes stop_codon:yes gene_type:complete